MTAGSTLPAVKQALITRLKARPGLAGVGINYAYPGDFAEGRDGDDIWLGRAVSEHQPLAMRGGGGLPMQEDYQLVVFLQSLKYLDDGQEAADLRATELLAELQQELATTPQTAADVLMTELDGWQHIPGPFATTPSAYGSRYECSVRVRGRLGT